MNKKYMKLGLLVGAILVLLMFGIDPVTATTSVGTGCELLGYTPYGPTYLCW